MSDTSHNPQSTIRNPQLLIGCAAGFGGDRVDAAGPVVDTLIRRGLPSVLIFEMLAERTLAQAQLVRKNNPNSGYAPLMEAAVQPILSRCVEHGIPIVSNFGAANPRAAARRLQEIAQEQGIPALRVAVVEGDDLSNSAGQALIRPYLDPAFAQREIISANVYLGGRAIAEGLRLGAQVVVTGRVADPALVVGPALAHFGWDETDWNRLACATMAGHLLECGAQVTGGYFADPGYKDVPELHVVGFPIAELVEDGAVVISKAEHTGGVVDCRTVKEQLLYEIHNPAAYLTPDVVADISDAEVVEVGPNRVALRGVCGHARPETLKAMVCFAGGWLGEGEISYAGANAEARARLAAEIIRHRIGDRLQLRFDLIGVLSVFGDDGGLALQERQAGDGRDVRLRVAGRHKDRSVVESLLAEVTSLYTCGPAGGGGIRTTITQQLQSTSCYLPRELIHTQASML
ncbi:MAG: acyclic terpene utilization AtuA family protein [Caldilineaceae bacterium]